MEWEVKVGPTHNRRRLSTAITRALPEGQTRALTGRPDMAAPIGGAVHGAGFAECFADRVREVLAPHEQSADGAIRKLREDQDELQLVDRDTKACINREPA